MLYFVKSESKEVNFSTLIFRMEKMNDLDEEIHVYVIHLLPKLLLLCLNFSCRLVTI